MRSKTHRISKEDLIADGFRPGWVKPFDEDDEAAADANSTGPARKRRSRAAENKARQRETLRSQGFRPVSTDATEEFVDFINRLGILSRQNLRLDEALDRITATDPNARRLAKSLLTLPEEARLIVERLIRNLIDGTALGIALDSLAGVDRQAEQLGSVMASLSDGDRTLIEQIIRTTVGGKPLEETLDEVASIDRFAILIGSRVLAATPWRQRIIGKLIDVRLPVDRKSQRKMGGDR